MYADIWEDRSIWALTALRVPYSVMGLEIPQVPGPPQVLSPWILLRMSMSTHFPISCSQYHNLSIRVQMLTETQGMLAHPMWAATACFLCVATNHVVIFVPADGQNKWATSLAVHISIACMVVHVTITCMCSQLSQLPPIVYYMWKSNISLSPTVNYSQLHNLSPQSHLRLTTYDYC